MPVMYRVNAAAIAHSGQSPAPASLVDRLKHRRKLALRVFVIAFALVCLVAVLLPKRFEAHMEFLIQNERVNSLISPDQKAQGILYLDEVGEARVNTEVALLSSDTALRRVVEETNLATTRFGSVSSNPRDQDVALRKLRHSLSIAPLRKSDIIQVKYEASNPKQAASVLRSLAASYLDLHLRLRSAKNSSTAFKQLTEMYANRQHIAQEALDAFKRERKIVALPEEKSVAMQRVADLEKQHADSSAARDRSAFTEAQLHLLTAATPATVVGQNKSIPNQYEIQQLSTLLINLTNKHIEASARYLPDDRLMKDMDQQIAQTQKALESAMDRRTEEITHTANPVLAEIQTESARASAEHAGFTSQASVVGQQLNESRKRLQDLDSDTAEYEELSQELKSYTAQRDLYQSKANEAVVSELLDQDRIANVKLADAPRESELPDSPHRGLIIGLGLVWSALLGIVSALIIDLLRKRVRSAADVERALRAPVLVEIRYQTLRPQNTFHLMELQNAMHRKEQTALWGLA